MGHLDDLFAAAVLCIGEQILIPDQWEWRGRQHLCGKCSCPAR